jgi:hypothetical protein
VRCLNFKAAVKDKCRKMDISYVKRTAPTYSASPAGLRVTAYALQIAHGQCRDCQHAYWVLRSSETSYIVLRREYLPTTSKVSRFAIPRVLHITRDRHMTCSCAFYQRHGIPCRHMYAILREVPKYYIMSLIFVPLSLYYDCLIHRSEIQILMFAGGLHTQPHTVIKITLD